MVLIILAAVAINLTLGNNGIFNKSKYAKQEYLNAKGEEDIQLAKVANEIDEYIDSIRETVTISKEEWEALKGQNTMSTTGHFTGEYWIDGKPIYAKTIYIDELPNKTVKKVNHNISNVNQIWIDYQNSFVIDSAGNSSIINYVVHNAIGGQLCVTVDKNDISITAGSDRSGFSAYVTLRYTETES